MQNFYIAQNATMPSLRMELINDGRYDFMKSAQFYNALQNADVTFSMIDENGKLRISKASASILLSGDRCCTERYIIEYIWKKKDTREKGHFIGRFEINFKSDLYEAVDAVCPNETNICNLTTAFSDDDYPEWPEIVGEPQPTHVIKLNETVNYKDGNFIFPLNEELNIYIR